MLIAASIPNQSTSIKQATTLERLAMGPLANPGDMLYDTDMNAIFVNSNFNWKLTDQVASIYSIQTSSNVGATGVQQDLQLLSQEKNRAGETWTTLNRSQIAINEVGDYRIEICPKFRATQNNSRINFNVGLTGLVTKVDYGGYYIRGAQGHNSVGGCGTITVTQMPVGPYNLYFQRETTTNVNTALDGGVVIITRLPD